MAFERFTLTRKKPRFPMVSIWKRGSIGFNADAVRYFDLDRYSFMVFYFDQDNQKIGFEPTNDQNADGAVRFTRRQNAFSVSATAFLKTYRVDFSKARCFRLLKEKDLLVIDLRQPLA